jgi:acetyltransferase-like isoleucine patch superfamily enzyme
LNYVAFFSGLTLGEGCVIAAGSMVTKGVQPYEIAGGVLSKNRR